MLKPIAQTDRCSLYQLESGGAQSINRFVASTEASRRICNDPTVFGVEYTEALKQACVEVLWEFNQTESCVLEEAETAVMHILRGGLNFGLREALHISLDWNRHVSAFVSAQRQRDEADTSRWHITEREYQKVYLPECASIILGDVVATGTSLQYAMDQLHKHIAESNGQIRSLVFFTIGSKKSEEIIAKSDAWLRERCEVYQGASVIYLEGCFAVAEPDTELSIKITGTDLIRRDSVLSPEFVESQYENSCYPLERCTIYDAGSRAFWLPEYLEDVREYWNETLALANNGMTFSQLLAERFPELSAERFGELSLQELCRTHLAKLG